jgi:hypothetical protein
MTRINCIAEEMDDVARSEQTYGDEPKATGR